MIKKDIRVSFVSTLYKGAKCKIKKIMTKKIQIYKKNRFEKFAVHLVWPTCNSIFATEKVLQFYALYHTFNFMHDITLPANRTSQNPLFEKFAFVCYLIDNK